MMRRVLAAAAGAVLARAVLYALTAHAVGHNAPAVDRNARAVDRNASALDRKARVLDRNARVLDTDLDADPDRRDRVAADPTLGQAGPATLGEAKPATENTEGAQNTERAAERNTEKTAEHNTARIAERLAPAWLAWDQWRAWDHWRTNYRGRPVSLAGGPALAVAAASSAALASGSLPRAAAALVAGLGAGAVGWYDDITPDHGAKGLRGHLSALRSGRVTPGVAKIVGVSAAGLAASALLTAGSGARGTARVRDVLLGAGVIAGTANLVNLLDLRPGRAGKAALVLAVPLLADRHPAGDLVAGPAGAVAALLPDDLGERLMLGDCGANAIGAQIGLALAARTGPAGRAALLAAIAALTLASEKVSFTKVIERHPVLRWLDELGRLGGGGD